MKTLQRLAVTITILVILVLATLWGLSQPRPTGSEGVEAEKRAAAFESAMGVAAWQHTGAVQWTFAGRNTHLWDRVRGLAKVQMGDTTVLVDLGKVDGRAYRNGQELQGSAREKAVQKGYATWINDSFWLNPLAKFRDQGVTRTAIDWEGQQGLAISYNSGGLTPGDLYLWLPGGPDGLPGLWRMWVSIIPVGGVSTTWEGWITLGTGARISTEHQFPGGITLRLTDVKGANTLGELVPGADPFAALF